jgi:site-specific recombinase XerD
MKTNYDYSKFNEWLILKKYSPHTIETIIETTEYFMQWAAAENIEEPEQAGYTDAIAFMQSLNRRGVLQKTVANYLGHVRKFFDFLMSDGIIKENPVAFIKVQGIKRRVYYTILTEEELQALYQNYPVTIEHEVGKNIPPQERNILSRKRNKVMLSLLIHQGLRVEEIKAVKLQDLQLR